MRHQIDTTINSFNYKENFFNSTYNVRIHFKDIIFKIDPCNTNNAFENFLIFSRKIYFDLYPGFVYYKKEKTIFLEYEYDKYEIVCNHCGHAHIPNSACFK